MFRNRRKNMLSSVFEFVLISNSCTLFFHGHQVLADCRIGCSFVVFSIILYVHEVDNVQISFNAKGRILKITLERYFKQKLMS